MTTLLCMVLFVEVVVVVDVKKLVLWKEVGKLAIAIADSPALERSPLLKPEENSLAVMRCGISKRRVGENPWQRGKNVFLVG